MKKFIFITERNHRERETWNFYFEATENNIKAFKIIKKIVETESSITFSFGELKATEKIIKGFPDSTNYMNTHNIIKGELDIPKLNEIKKYDSEFNKGGIAGFMKKKFIS